jgi:hypothetical protein
MGRRPGGISAEKTSLNSCKRLVTGAGKVRAISSLENKASVHTKRSSKYHQHEFQQDQILWQALQELSNEWLSDFQI